MSDNITEEEILHPDDKPFSIELRPSQIEIMSKFFTKQRIDGDEHLNILFSLDDKYKKIYNKHRINSFSVAQQLATTYVINCILTNDY